MADYTLYELWQVDSDEISTCELQTSECVDFFADEEV